MLLALILQMLHHTEIKEVAQNWVELCSRTWNWSLVIHSLPNTSILGSPFLFLKECKGSVYLAVIWNLIEFAKPHISGPGMNQEFVQRPRLQEDAEEDKHRFMSLKCTFDSNKKQCAFLYTVIQIIHLKWSILSRRQEWCTLVGHSAQDF